MPYLDINTADWPFDPQDDQLSYPGTWYLYGSIDALNSFEKRTLQAPFDIFQQDYDDGWDHGMYNKQYLMRTSF